MRIMGRRRLSILSLTLLGALLGAVAGFWLGRAMLLRAARNGLSDYAWELAHRGDEITAEVNGIFHSADHPLDLYCSDKEIDQLRTLTFGSRDFKDIGRIHNDKLLCSAFLGRLSTPYQQDPPDLVLADGTLVYINVAVILGSANDARATIFEARDLNAVLSPSAFYGWDRPHVQYRIYSVNHVTGRMVPIAGAALPVDPSWVLSRGLKTIAGVIYRARCSDVSPVCAVTAESLSDIWAGSRAMQFAYSTMGGLAGIGFGLALALLYRQSTGLTQQLQRAIRQSSPSIYLLYQPLVDIHTRQCVGAEALVRWSDENGVAISPEVFVRIAEERCFISELTALVVRLATRETGDLLRGHPGFTLSINVAASDLEGEQLFQLLEQHVVGAGIDPSQIAIELTERSTADLAMVREGLHRLCAQGYKVHIDDFGTGFSSLSYLDQLDVDAIKIDRAFTRTIGTDALTAPILPQMLAMAESLGLEVIVEGVETEIQNLYLESTGRHLQVQGWYFSKPISAEALAVFQQDTRPRMPAPPDQAPASTEVVDNHPVSVP